MQRADAFTQLVVDDVEAPALDPVDERHLVKVLRVRSGASLAVTDGAGNWRMARWNGSAMEADGEVSHVPKSDPSTVGLSPLKGDRTEFAVQKATELGIGRIVLITDAERAVVRWDGARRDKVVARLRRIVREAVMQSRNVWIPSVVCMRLREAIDDGAAMAHFDGNRADSSTRWVLAGPEGGWSESELAMCDRRVGLGDSVLRAETAVITAVALMNR